MDQERAPGTIGQMAGEATNETAKTAQQGGDQGAAARMPTLDQTVDTVKALADQARAGAARAGAVLQDAAREAGVQVNDAATQLRRQGSQAGDYLRRQTSDRPLLALLIAGTIGFLAALLLRRRG